MLGFYVDSSIPCLGSYAYVASILILELPPQLTCLYVCITKLPLGQLIPKAGVNISKSRDKICVAKYVMKPKNSNKLEKWLYD